MVLIFVARDSDELKKYKAAIGPSCAFSTWSLKPVSKSDGMTSKANNMDGDVELSEDEWNEESDAEEEARLDDLRCYEIRYFHKIIQADGAEDHVFLLEGIPQKDEAKYNVKFPQDHVNVYMEIFTGLVKYVVGDKVADKDIFAFIHWGVVSPSECDREFRKKIMQTDHRNINSFSVSKTRQRCFDVTGDKVRLPDNHQEICDVILRFTYELVKDLLSEYVWNGKLELSENAFSQLDFYLHDWLSVRLKDVSTKEDTWRLAAIEAWEDAKVKCTSTNDSEDLVIGENKKLTALFSDLIANGGRI